VEFEQYQAGEGPDSGFWRLPRIVESIIVANSWSTLGSRRRFYPQSFWEVASIVGVLCITSGRGTALWFLEF